jgi:hypothetical protein
MHVCDAVGDIMAVSPHSKSGKLADRLGMAARLFHTETSTSTLVPSVSFTCQSSTEASHDIRVPGFGRWRKNQLSFYQFFALAVIAYGPAKKIVKRERGVERRPQIPIVPVIRMPRVSPSVRVLTR